MNLQGSDSYSFAPRNLSKVDRYAELIGELLQKQTRNVNSP